LSGEPGRSGPGGSPVPRWIAERDLPGRRLFVAVPLSSDVRDDVVHLVERVRATVGMQPGPGPGGPVREVRWVRMDGLHLTLRFLGPTLDERIPALAYSAVGLDNVLTNPLHLGLITSAIANGGTLYEPRLVTEVRDAQGQVVREFPKQDYGQPISANTAATMRQMMVSVTQGGTATTTFAGFPVTVAGKTGTATNGEDRPPNAWFTAFAPAGPTETPTIAVTVIVLDGGNLGNEATGGVEAAPIAREIIRVALGL